LIGERFLGEECLGMSRKFSKNVFGKRAARLRD
jgi:hypothetical protein